MPKKNYSKWTKSAAASMLAFSLVATPYAISFGENGKPNVSQKSASAAVLDIELLSNMTLTNDSGTTTADRFQLNPDGTQDVNFTVSGASLAQASTIVSGKKQVVLGVPTELQGLVQPNGEAQIDSSITLRINEVPLVKPVLDATNAVLGAITSALSATPGIQINLAEVNKQLNLLNNLGEVGQGTFTAPVTVNADGSVLSAPIDDGLGLILAQNLNTVLTDLNNAIQALTATGSGLITGAAATALNTALIPLKLTVSTAVSTLKAVITAGGAIINQLADAAVLGDTEIVIPTKVTGPADYLNTNPTLDAGFVGSVVKGNVITLDLFQSSDGKSTVYYQGNPDDFAVPAAPTDVATTGNSTDGYEVKGKAEPNADVTVYDKDGNEVGTGTADANGDFTITVPGSVGPEADLTVTATNANGESDPASTETPADPVVAPTAPTDVATTGNSTDGYEVTGKTEPGATVNVYDKDGNEVGTGTADENGDFTVAVPGTVGPEADLTVKAENAAGEGDGVDTKTPADPVVAPAAPTDVTTTGNSTDGYEVVGKTEPGATVNVYDKDGNEVGTGTADENGDFTVSVPGSVGPEADLTVKAENAAGEGDGVDTKTPADPVVAPAAPTDVTTTGNSTDGYEVVGKAEPGATVNIYDKDGNEVGTGTADENGDFTVSVPGSVGPEADLTVKAENAAGEGDGVDTKTPADEVVAPAAPTDVTTTGNSTDGYEVVGKAEPGATVNVYDKDGNEVGTGTADENGDFTISVPGSVGPEADLTVKAENAAGEGDGVDTKTPADDVVAPAAPTDVTTTGNSTDGYEVVGKAEPGATVNIYDKDGNEVGTGTADENGDFTVTVPGSVGPEADLTVKAENAAGEGDGVDTKTPADEVVAPAAPTDVTTTGNSTDGYEVVGKAEPGATVNVYDKDGNEVGTGTADENGDFTVAVPGSVGPEADLTVKAENAAGEGDGVDTKTPADDVVAPEAPTDLAVDGNPTDGYEVTGKTDPNTDVTIYDKDGNEVGSGTSDADGNFTITVPGTVGPEADLTVKAENEAGSSEGTVKTPAISGAIVVNEIKEFNTLIKGTAPKGTEKVKLTVNGKDLTVTTVNPDGTFEFDRKYVYDADGNKKVLGAGDEIVVSYYGPGKQPVTAGETIVQPAELQITMDAVEVQTSEFASTKITGTAGPDVERVRLSVNGVDLTTIAVNADGTYEFDRKYVYDADGNKKLLGAGDIVRVTVADNGKQNYYAEQAVTSTAVAPVVISNVDKATYTITGTTDASVSKVQLSVNGKALANYDVVDGEFTITRKYVYDADGNKKILGAGDVITIRNYEKLKDGQASITVPAD